MDEFVKSERKSVKANGIDVHYLERGVVGAPTVVMFHAIGMSAQVWNCLLYTSPSPRDATLSRVPSSA